MEQFFNGQTLRHLDLGIIGTVETYITVRVHVPNSPVREMVNVKVGDDDLVWWNVARVVPYQPAPAVTPALSMSVAQVPIPA